MKNIKFKSGYVAMVGRPNVGKSTLLNALVNHKVAIVSPKAQTTRSQITALYEDDRGQIFFFDTPGYYDSSKGSRRYNGIIKESIKNADLIVYVVDHTRKWGDEDAKVFNQVINSDKPKILVLNKKDIKHPTNKDLYIIQCEDDMDEIIETSALNNKHIEGLRSLIFKHLPQNNRDNSVDQYVSPLLSQNSHEYLAELVREKIYLHTGQEIPYQTRVQITSIDENIEKNRLKIRGKIIVNNKKYKPMLIGAGAQKIKQISNATAKELHFMTQKDINIKLTVVVEK